MTIAEKIESILIIILGAICWVMASNFPVEIGLSDLLFVVSGLILLQGLIRDVWLLSRPRHYSSTEKVTAQCICIESTLGITGILVGAILLSSRISISINIIEWFWSVLVIGVLGVGFLIKDYVIEWGTWQIRQEKNHLNIIIGWKQ